MSYVSLLCEVCVSKSIHTFSLVKQSFLQACRSGDHSKVQKLLEAKANVNYKDEVCAHISIEGTHFLLFDNNYGGVFEW